MQVSVAFSPGFATTIRSGLTPVSSKRIPFAIPGVSTVNSDFPPFSSSPVFSLSSSEGASVVVVVVAAVVVVNSIGGL